MTDIVEWLSHIEEQAAEIYRQAAGIFADDPSFALFLNSLAEEEMQHSRMIRAAFSGNDLIKKEEIATTIDEETRQFVVGALDGVMQKVGCPEVSKEEIVAMIGDVEFFEWNGLFLYAINVLKRNSPEYASAKNEIEHHLKGIEAYLLTLTCGQQVLNKIRSIPSRHRLRVLVVEDDPALAFLIKSILIRDAEVDIAGNGQEGLEWLESGAFDVIVTDVEMPVMNGIDMYREIVRREGYLKERFVFLTAGRNPEVRNFLVEQKVPVLSKPAPIKLIRQAVLSVSERRCVLG